jgi:hypothetical protein
LDDAYKTWRAQPFPPASVDHELSDLHVDLGLVDAWVAEAVIPFVERRRYMFAAADLRAGILGVRDRAHALAASRNGHDADLARCYVAYAEQLDVVYAQLERAIAESSSSN